MTRLARIKPTGAAPEPPRPQSRKPRLVVAGEFSAGKTRLISGLLGQGLLPATATATALPPVWLVPGAARMAAVGLDGTLRDLDSLAEASVDDTAYCVVAHPAPILEHVEIIDTPGSCDPSIPATAWERMIGYADLVLWCTNATQAWRPSEKTVWEEMPTALRDTAMAVVTHADRLADERSAQRVLRRVKREAKPYFAQFDIASLIRTADIDRLAARLVARLAEGLDHKGQDNPVLTALQAHWSAPARLVPPQPTRARRRPGPKAATIQSIGNVVMLNAEATPPPAIPNPPSVRTTWSNMLATVDSSDPAALLGCMDRFIALLEHDSSAFRKDRHPPQATPTTASIKSRVKGR